MFLFIILRYKFYSNFLFKLTYKNGIINLHLTAKSAEKGAVCAETSKAEEHSQLPHSLAGDDTDAVFRERLKNMGKCKCSYNFIFKNI